MIEVTSLLSMAFAMSIPLILGVLGGLFTYNSGVLNIALEGMMAAGAFTSILYISYTGNLLVGVIVGVLASLLMGLIFSFFSITMKGHNIIVGLGINMAVASIAPYLCLILKGNRTSIIVSDVVIPSEISLNVPILRSIPTLSEILNNHTPIAYISVGLIFVVSIILYHTKFGIYTQVSGENADAVKAAGINVNKVRYGTVALSAIFCGLAGVNMSVENLGMYTNNMVSGRGFICLAAIYCGKGRPLRSVAYALLFGFARALQVQLTTIVSTATASLLEMLPYLLIVLVMFLESIPEVKRTNLRGYKGG